MRIVRIVERTGLEAHLARLDRWWSGLSGRERALLAVLGVVAALAILVYGVVKPLQAARAEAIADIRTFEGLNARLRAAGRIEPPAERATGAPDVIVRQAATRFGLDATVVPVPGGVRATVADGAYGSVVDWVADISRTSALAPAQARISRRADPGRVTAQVDFVQ